MTKLCVIVNISHFLKNMVGDYRCDFFSPLSFYEPLFLNETENETFSVTDLLQWLLGGVSGFSWMWSYIKKQNNKRFLLSLWGICGHLFFHKLETMKQQKNRLRFCWRSCKTCKYETIPRSHTFTLIQANMFLVLYLNVYLYTVSTFHYWQEASPLFSTALIPKFASFEANNMPELFLHTSRGSKWWCAKTWSCSLCLKLACLFFSILHTSHSLSRFYCVVRRHVWSKYSL